MAWPKLSVGTFLLQSIIVIIIIIVVVIMSLAT
jgi:hypothetical protein